MNHGGFFCDSMKITTLFATIPLLTPLAVSASCITFDELAISDCLISKGGFTSQGVEFNLTYNSTYQSWDGIALTNFGKKYVEAADPKNQFCLADPTPPVTDPDESEKEDDTDANNQHAVVYDPGSYGTSPEIDLPEDLYAPQSMEVTNTAYAWAAMVYGNDYSTAFSDGSWFKLTVSGYDANDEVTGSTEFYLADYRDNDAAKHYIITDYTTVDLTPLGDNVSKIKFAIASSDTGDNGINTPAYFAFDNLVVHGSRLWESQDYSKSAWYGDMYAYQKGDGWIYSYDNYTFQYVSGTDDDAWVYDPQLGNYWTSSELYPKIYIYDLGTWALAVGQEADTNDDLTGTASAREYQIYSEEYTEKLPNYPIATAAEIAGLRKK